MSASAPHIDETARKNREFWKAARFSMLLFLFEAFIILCYAFSTDYAVSAQASDSGVIGAITNNTATSTDAVLVRFAVVYQMFSGVHIMIFIGFGFLMTFLHAYAWSAVGFNFLLSALAVQWSMLTVPFFHMAWEGHWQKISFDVYSLINGDFAAGALMISFGAVLGKTSSTQLLVMMIMEMIIYAMNETMVTHALTAIDMGGSMVIHTFGAYFGLTVSAVIGNPGKKDNINPAYSKWSSTVAMVGTIFLWIYWPSFNAALAGVDSQQQRVVINTLLSISGSCISAFFISRFFRPGKKFDFEELQNATLAGGVAVGSSSDLVIRPWGALLLGNVAGIISALGFIYLTPRLNRFIHDTCGVNNLHGMPGILGGVAGAISAGTAGSTAYGAAISSIFPARHPVDPAFPFAKGWSATTQGAYQFAALMVTIAFAIGGGLITGFIMKLRFFDPYTTEDLYEDCGEWETAHLDTDKLSGRIISHDDHAHTPSATEVELASTKAKALTFGDINPSVPNLTAADVQVLVAREVQAALARQAAAPSPAVAAAAAAEAPKVAVVAAAPHAAVASLDAAPTQAVATAM